VRKCALDILFGELHRGQEMEEPLPPSASPNSTLLQHQCHQLLCDDMKKLRRRSQRLNVPFTPEQNDRACPQQSRP
jgi:hypothetical protein